LKLYIITRVVGLRTLRFKLGAALSIGIASFVLIHVLGCGRNNQSPTSAVGAIVIVSGNEQVGEPGDTLHQPLIVLLTDSEGHPSTNRRIDFAVSSASARLSRNSTVTDESGFASTLLILGNQEGSVSVSATAFGSAESVVFTALSFRQPTSMTVLRGRNQEAMFNQDFDDSLVVLVLRFN